MPEDTVLTIFLIIWGIVTLIIYIRGWILVLKADYGPTMFWFVFGVLISAGLALGTLICLGMILCIVAIPIAVVLFIVYELKKLFG